MYAHLLKYFFISFVSTLFLAELFIQTSSVHNIFRFPTLTSAANVRTKKMSQLQFQCPPSSIPAASAPLQLGQPQPGYSIPCAAGALPSESASQPIRSSALPAGSATPYITTTGLFAFLYYTLLQHAGTYP